MRIVSAEALASYMAYRGYSVRGLADRAGVNKSVIGHLRNPKSGRNTCKPEAARKIAKALDVPVNALFIDKVSRVVRDVPGSRAAA